MKYCILVSTILLYTNLVFSQSIVGTWETGLEPLKNGLSVKTKYVFKGNGTFDENVNYFSQGKSYIITKTKGKWKKDKNILYFENGVSYDYDVANNRTDVNENKSYNSSNTLFEFKNKNILLFVTYNEFLDETAPWMTLIRL
jgi:hypothetical protein